MAGCRTPAIDSETTLGLRSFTAAESMRSCQVTRAVVRAHARLQAVGFALDDADAGRPHVRQPLLQLLGPHQAHGGRHHHQQRPLVLRLIWGTVTKAADAAP